MVSGFVSTRLLGAATSRVAIPHSPACFFTTGFSASFFLGSAAFLDSSFLGSAGVSASFFFGSAGFFTSLALVSAGFFASLAFETSEVAVLAPDVAASSAVVSFVLAAGFFALGCKRS